MIWKKSKLRKKQSYNKEQHQLAITAEMIFKEKYQVYCDFTDFIYPLVLEPYDVRKRMVNSGSDLECIEIVGKEFPMEKFIDLLKPIYQKLQKSDTLAKIFLKRGIKYRYYEKQTLAWRSFNLAVAYATKQSKLLPRLYWEISTELFREDNMEGCLAAMKLALVYNASGSLKKKLVMRKLKCRQLIDGFEAEKSKEQLENEDYVNNTIFKVHGEYKSGIPQLGNYISKVAIEGKGFGFVADVDLEPGTTIIVEKPFVSLDEDELELKLHYCYAQNCFQQVEVGVSCCGCVFAVYCSIECMVRDYEDGHKYICGCLPFLYSIPVNRNVHLAVKAVCKSGPELLYDIFKLMMGKGKLDDILTLKDSDGNIEPYSHVLGLCYHIDILERPKTSITCYTIVQVLNMTSNFFNGVPEIHRTVFMDFVASFLLQHSQSFPVNKIGMYRKIKKSGRPGSWAASKPRSETSLEITGTGIYPIANLMNHDCDPNVFRHQRENGQIVIMTNRRVAKGEELLFSYGAEFSTHLRLERYVFLSGFNFQCGCFACVNNWPIILHMDEEKRVCANCSHNFIYKNLCEVDKCLLYPDESAGVYYCKNCKSFHNKEEFDAKILKYKGMLESSRELIKSRPLDAIPMLKKCIEHFQKVSVGRCLHRDHFVKTALQNSKFLAKCITKNIELE